MIKMEIKLEKNYTFIHMNVKEFLEIEFIPKYKGIYDTRFKTISYHTNNAWVYVWF